MKPKHKPTKHWWHWPWALIWFIAAPVLSALIVFQIFAFVRNPDATVEVRAMTHNYCVAYSVQLMHSQTIDQADFEIRFPSRLNDVKMGVPENIGASEENWMRIMIGDLNMDACFLGTGGNPVDTSGVSSHVTGNTLFVRSETLIGHTPIQGYVIGPTHQSTSEPAPNAPQFQGEYSYTVFGTSVHRSLKYVNAGTNEMK